VSAPPESVPAPPAVADRAVGRSSRGTLLRREDPRLGRPVLVELLDVPAEGDALARLRAVAAAGGPHVQRLLALSDDGAMVTYEVCEGTPIDAARLATLDGATAAALQEAERVVTLAVRLGDPADTAHRSPRVVQTAGGAVVLVVEAEGGD